MTNPDDKNTQPTRELDLEECNPMTTPTTRSQEEIELEMKSRFDAANQAAMDRRQQRRDGGGTAAVEENRQLVMSEAETAEVPEVGDNDALGGNGR